MFRYCIIIFDILNIDYVIIDIICFLFILMQYGVAKSVSRGRSGGRGKKWGRVSQKKKAAYFVRNSRVSKGEKVATVGVEY